MKKLIALFLVFSLLVLSGNLYASKKGAEIIVYKKGEEMPDNRWKGTTWEKKPSKPVKRRISLRGKSAYTFTSVQPFKNLAIRVSFSPSLIPGSYH